MAPHPLIGQMAPSNFTLQNQNNEPINLADLVGQSPVVLFFYPQDGTSKCTEEVCAFRDQYQAFTKKDVQVIGISRDSVESHATFASSHSLQFHILSDEKDEVKEAYKVPKTALGLLPGRSTFIINREGVVVEHFSSLLDINGHVKTALKLVESL
ncbi:anti-oxidant AhpCTSA family protein [Jimgerdemannia flammicorona]|uniref:thioredoxin-dependent peroxiredoxin n=1 Tax=Jimgerdemannia flammicorona TaxID=994334 RepID=A0A433QRB2_9FUNG|nr:anti-oxidant AhpCTSA family protein [Jimgerdemannia flammicorona]